jgi:hypothetical protein
MKLRQAKKIIGSMGHDYRMSTWIKACNVQDRVSANNFPKGLELPVWLSQRSLRRYRSAVRRKTHRARKFNLVPFEVTVENGKPFQTSAGQPF